MQGMEGRRIGRRMGMSKEHTEIREQLCRHAACVFELDVRKRKLEAVEIMHATSTVLHFVGGRGHLINGTRWAAGARLEVLHGGW